MGGGEKGKVERLIEEEHSGRGRREGCDRRGEDVRGDKAEGQGDGKHRLRGEVERSRS